MSAYDKEYFYDFDAYKKIEQQQPVPMNIDYGNHSFNFYEIGFKNGCKAYLFDTTNEATRFVQYFNINNEFVKYLGKTEEIYERVINETIKRGVDFIEECNRLSDDREILLFVAPFKLSYEEDPASELGELLQNVQKGK